MVKQIEYKLRGIFSLTILGIGSLVLFNSCLPKPPKYPFRPTDELNKAAQVISDSLENYIKLWYKGKASAQLPERLLPKGYDTSRFSNIRLVRKEDLDAKKIWATRPAHEIDFKKLYGSFPDPHCTYLLAPFLYAPFGAKLYIEGEFPYCRFFNIQVSPPFDPREYRYDKWSGIGEVGIVDSDILPIKGHENPFLPGAHRNVKNRSYRVVYEMAIGDPTKLDASHHPPYYRAPGSIRYGSAIQVQGPWGLNKKPGHGRGIWDCGDVWIRYYGIDKDKPATGGVEFPTMYYELKTGEKFFIVADFPGFIKASETTMANRNKGNSNPASYNGAHTGWDKQFGIFLQIATGLSFVLHKEKPKDMQYLRDMNLGINGRGENQPAPGSYEPNATACNYTHYFTSGTSIKKGKVFIITGKLPTFPDTRKKGADVFEKADCRYWSITSYDSEYPFAKIAGLENTSVMDDEMVLDKNNKYIIVYSRAEDRPKNATKENGVTWVDWGQTSTQSLTIRWISVGPEWMMNKAPNEINLPWAKATRSGSQYDKNIIGSNNNKGYLGEYHPVKHYMTKKDFESLGNNLKSDAIPDWNTYQ